MGIQIISIKKLGSRVMFFYGNPNIARYVFHEDISVTHHVHLTNLRKKSAVPEREALQIKTKFSILLCINSNISISIQYLLPNLALRFYQSLPPNILG